MTRAGAVQAEESIRRPRRLSPVASDGGPVLDDRHRPARWPDPSSSAPRRSFTADESSIIDEFTERWEDGKSPRIEEFLERIGPSSSELAVELIYKRFCLEEAKGSAPSSAKYLDEFAVYREELGRLFQLHGVFTCSQIRRLAGSDEDDSPAPYEPELPSVGDEIGPFLLRRELGRGSFARVFLAEQTDLENRLVVIKVTSRPSREPWLLARARHPHIVEIISQFEVDDGDIQLICMPFWGGATLARLLEEWGRPGAYPASGRGILNDLDAVAAHEYPEDRRSATTREIVAGSSADRSMAWMVARLAEALDYASTRKVAHGDIKPSNILISADANPMLLDFNLAQDWAWRDDGLGPIDRGGTLAYMAPERLRALSEFDGAPAMPAPLSDPHSADLYSLGMVFLEMLSGRQPTVLEEVEPAPWSRRGAATDLRKSAGELAKLRSVSSPVDLIRRLSGDRIPPTLRSILARCLDPDPANRYQRGQHLATDLDRWRTDRPLVHAPEDTFHATCRRFRRARKPLVAAAVVVLAAASVGVAVTLSLNSRTVAMLAKMGLEKLANFVDATETRIFGFLQIPSAAERLENSYSPIARSEEWSGGAGRMSIRPEVQSKSMEIATLALKDYQLLAPEGWREREDVRYLPNDEREDLELWLMEQAYRYCHELASRPDSPEDWERALAALKHLSATTPLTAFARLGERLERELAGLIERQNGLGRTEPISIAADDRGPPPLWLDEYVLGVALECEAATPPSTSGEMADNHDGSPDERILSHYRTTLAHRPESFWAHYRSSIVSGRLGLTADRSAHLEACLRRRPANPAIHGQLAGCLFRQNRLGEALVVCDRAIELDPDHAEYYRTRAFIDADLGRSEETRGDIHRFEILSRVLPAEFLKTRVRLNSRDDTSGTRNLRLAFDAGRSGSVDSLAEDRVSGRRIASDPEDLDARFNLAKAILDKGRDAEQVIIEINKILALDPNYFHARILRAGLLVQSGTWEDARRDLDRILRHPNLEDFLFDKTDVTGRFIDISWAYMGHARHEEAIKLAQKALEFADTVKQHVGRANYTVARAYARAARKNPADIDRIAHHLEASFERTDPRDSSGLRKKQGGFRVWYAKDRSFDAIRTGLDRAIARAEKDETSASAVQASLERGPSKVAD